MEQSSLAVIKQGQDACEEKISQLFLPLKECKDVLTELPITIKNACEWDTDIASLDVLRYMLQLYLIYVNNNAEELQQFRSLFAIPLEEKKENEKKEQKAPNLMPFTAKKGVPSHRHGPAPDSSAIKSVVAKDEKLKEEILAASKREEKKIETPELPKAKKKKKKKKLAKASAPAPSAPTPAYKAEETKLVVSSNLRASPFVKSRKILKPGDAISNKVFFAPMLSEGSATTLFDFLQHTPVAIFEDKFVSSAQLGGSLAVYGLICCLALGEYPPFKPVDIDLFFKERQFSMGLENNLKQHDFVHQLSVKKKFTKYVCHLASPDNKEMACELTLTPDSKTESLNSIPLSDIRVVADRDTQDFYFINITPELQADIAHKIFRTAIPSTDASAPHESYFLTRFLKYYTMLVIQSGWHIEEKTKSILRIEFLIPYLVKVKNQSFFNFQNEIGRLIEYHQKQWLKGNPDEREQLIRDILQHILLAWFSILVPPEKTENINYAPLLTTSFLNLLRENKLPPKSAEQKYGEWIINLLKMLKPEDSYLLKEDKLSPEPAEQKDGELTDDLLKEMLRRKSAEALKMKLEKAITICVVEMTPPPSDLLVNSVFSGRMLPSSAAKPKSHGEFKENRSVFAP